MSFHKIIKTGIVLVIGLSSTYSFAQSGAVKQAEKKMGQGNWTSARQSLIKSLQKEPNNPEIEIWLTKWYLNSKNPNQQIDTAYKYSLLSLGHYRQLTAKQKEKLKRDLVDSISIVSLRKEIDSIAFDRAKKVNSEKSYNDYLEAFQFSTKRYEATELRDEAAFLEALRQNSYKAFENYIHHYPQSHRVYEAKARYEKLLFESLTRDRKLKSYEAFVKGFPENLFRKEAEKNIFEVLTSDGTVANFIKFIDEHPNSTSASDARNILFHLSNESEEKFPERLMTDSLKNVLNLGRLPWAPVYKNGKYGFIDSQGAEALPLQFESIDENYKCGSVNEDILMTNMGLVSRSGKILSKARSFRDLGYGFIKVMDGSCASVMHKSGKVTVDCIEDASILEGRFLRITKNKLVGLLSLNGRMLLKPQWQSIEMMENVIVLDRHGKKSLITPAQLAIVADENPLQENLVFDEVKVIGKNRLLVSNGSLEGIVNSNLELIIPLQMQILLQTPFGTARQINDQFIFSDLPELNEEPWDNYWVHRQWLRLKNASVEELFDTYSKKIVETNPDSLWFENGLAFALQNDSIRIHINSSARIKVPKDSKLFFIKSPDSVRYFFAQQKNKKTIFSIESGVKMFTTDFDQIEALDAKNFIAFKKNKKGIVDLKGKTVLPIEYDVFILKQGHLSLYKDKKFGLYSLSTKQLIKPTFEKNVMVLDSSTLIAFQNGRYGLIDWSGKTVIGFEYDEIQPWAKGIVWAKRDFEWSLIDFHQQKKILARIKNFQLIKNTSEEKIAIIKQDNFYGVVSSKNGVIIPPSFSFLMNLGNEEDSIYFTSKEVEEAGVVVVIYYDRSGKFLRKQVYEDEEYAHIVCPQE
ncbi:MAG: WG repeat-containing protein [Bacteroidetes bacterium]|nr:WG repeat-containing protein [Bacteroidota bacterium]